MIPAGTYVSGAYLPAEMRNQKNESRERRCSLKRVFQ